MILADGYCPMGCGEQLILKDHRLWCVYHACPRPTAAAEILADSGTRHIIEIAPDGKFSIWHPLRERLDNASGHCALLEILLADGLLLDLQIGRYQADTDSQADWSFEKLALR